MNETIYRLLLKLDADTESLRREMKKADATIAAHEKKSLGAIDRMEAGWKRSGRWIKENSAQFKLLGAAAVAGAGVATKAIIDYSDQYKNLQGQLKLVTDSQDELNKVWDSALALSNDTGASLDATVNLYARMARSTEQLGLSNDDLLKVTKLVNQSFVVSGASATEAASATLQLSQGLAAGALRGEELNSVMENSPRLATALAKGLGVTIGQLREMGKQGELTTESVVNALKSQSAAINREFEQMPVTVARATNKIKNSFADAFGKADLSPIVEEVENFAEIIGDPNTIKALTDVGSAIVSLTGFALKGASAFAQFAEDVGEGAAELLGASAAAESTMDKVVEKYAELSKAADDFRGMGLTESKKSKWGLLGEIWGGNSLDRTLAKMDEINEWLSVTDQQIVKIDGKFVLVKGSVEKYLESLKEGKTDTLVLAGKTDELAGMYGELTDELNRGGRALQGFNDWSRKQSQQTRDVIDALDQETQEVGLSSRALFINAEVRKAGANATAEEIAEIRKKAGALFDLRNTNEKVTDDISKMWGDARETLSDFFFEFAKDGDEALDNLLNSFKATISKMAAEVAANEIFLQVGGALGGFETDIGKALFSQIDGRTLSSFFDTNIGQAPVGEAGSTQAGPPVSRAGSGDVATGASAQSAQGGLGGVSAASLGWAALAVGIFRTLDDLQSGMYGLGDVATANNLNIKYGKQFGPLGDFLFPQGKDIESFGFAAAGDPISAYAINKYTDSGTAGLINNITGFKDGGNNSALGFFDFMEKQFSAEGVGKNFSEKNLQMVEDLLTPLQAFADVIGGSEFSGQFRAGNRVGLKVNGQKFKETGDFLNYMFDEIAKGATDLEPVLQDLILGFEGTAEQVMQFTGAIVSMHDQSQINSVTQAIEDFAAATPTALQSYRDQTATLTTLITNFDGSAAAAQELAETLAQNKAAAYEYVISLQQVAEQMGLVTKAQADYFRESALSEDELFRKRVNERDFFRAILDEVTDPENAQQAFQKVADLNRQIFDMLERGADGVLSATQQSLLGIQDGSATGTADVFATYIEDANAALQSIIGDTIGELQGTQEDMNARIATLLQNSAQIFQQASDTALEASQNMITAAQTMQSAADTLAGAAEVV